MHISGPYEHSVRDLVCVPSPHVTLQAVHEDQSNNAADVTSIVVASIVEGGAVVAGGAVVSRAFVAGAVVTSGRLVGSVLGNNDCTSDLVVASGSLKQSFISSENAWHESILIRDSNISA